MKKFFKLIFDNVVIISTIIVISYVLQNYIVFPYKVNGTSMYPTLKDGDTGIYIRFSEIERFDIAVINNNGEYIIKRIIGLPNETVEYVDNVLYINGIKYEEPFLVNAITEDFYYEVPEGEYFCLGDNREYSYDSRYIGSFKEEQIEANSNGSNPNNILDIFTHKK